MIYDTVRSTSPIWITWQEQPDAPLGAALPFQMGKGFDGGHGSICSSSMVSLGIGR